MTAVAAAYGDSFFGAYTGVAEEWGDGKFTVSDITAPVGAGLDFLGLFLDPVNWIVGNLLEPIYNWIFENVKPLKQAIEMVTGSPDQVRASAAAYQEAAQGVAAQANALIEQANSVLSDWEGQARESFRATVELVVRNQTQMTEGLHKLAELTYAAAMIVSAVKEIVVGLIKELITELITKAVMVALAAIPTLGAAIAAYMSWAAAKYSLVVGKISLAFSKLFKKASTLFKKGSKLGDLLGKLGDRMGKFADKAFETSRAADRARAGAEGHRARGRSQYEAADRSYDAAKQGMFDEYGNPIPGRTHMDQVHEQSMGNHQRSSGDGEFRQARREHEAVTKTVDESGVKKPQEHIDNANSAVSDTVDIVEEHEQAVEDGNANHNPAEDIGKLDD